MDVEVFAIVGAVVDFVGVVEEGGD